MSAKDSAEHTRKRGRPRTLDKETILNVLNKHKQRLCIDNNGQSIVSKHDKIWQEMAEELQSAKSAESLYNYVTCDKDNVRLKLWANFGHKDATIDECDLDISGGSIRNSTLDSSIETENQFEFVIRMPAVDFDKLIETRTIYRGKKKQPYPVKKFLKNEWQHFITKKIWDNTRLQCGYNFRNHYFNNEVTWGHFIGRCDCGSKIDCTVERNDGIITINCSTTKGMEVCGKRPVRGSERTNLGNQLRTKSAHVIRAELADDLMGENDCEPAHLPKASTLRQIKHQETIGNYLDKDLMKSLELLSLFDMDEEISSIGYKPFFVHYSTKHQRTVYSARYSKEPAHLEIDATGSIIQPITRVNKKHSGPIFLYIAVLCTPSGQTSVAQMLSERHTTGAILFWLTQWTEHWGLAPPKEIVCDMSRSLLASAIRAYTTSRTINQYADAFLNDSLPTCYIRIDIAHFIKTWVNFLARERYEVAKFYKTCIGKIVLCRNIEAAQRVIEATLTIARSEYCGMTDAGSPSACDHEKAYMKKVLTTDDLTDLNIDQYILEVDEDDDDDDETESQSNAEPSMWRIWGKKIDDKVQHKINNYPGTEISAHWLPNFADRLVEELKWLPLWSCVVRDKYGYGRCPASSTHVEAEFKTIKNQVLKDATLPIRADDFIRRHKKYIDGISKLITAQPQASTDHFFDPALKSAINDNLEDDPGSIPATSDNLDYDSPSRYNEKQPNEVRTSQNASRHFIQDCPACKNGDIPGGAHQCMICNQAVHALEFCSLPAENCEEGFGQKRICRACSEKPNVFQLVESRARENWFNNVANYEQKQSRGRYLQLTYPENEFSLTAAPTSISILKSGAAKTLKPVRKGEERVDLIQTCTFDSLFQLFLSAAFDSALFLTSLQEDKDKIKFYALIDDVKSNGSKTINLSTYRKRMEILSEHFEKTGHPELNCFVINCKTTVAAMAKKILKNVPCFIETLTCTGQCSSKINGFPLLSVSLQALMSIAMALNTNEEHDNEYDKINAEIDIVVNRRCLSEGCDGTVTSTLNLKGDLLLLELLGNCDSETVVLNDIPKKIKLSIMNDEFNLRGIVHFDCPPDFLKLRNPNDAIGHYTAICYRNRNWYQFDKKTKSKQGDSKVSPHLILYSK